MNLNGMYNNAQPLSVHLCLMLLSFSAVKVIVALSVCWIKLS